MESELAKRINSNYRKLWWSSLLACIMLIPALIFAVMQKFGVGIIITGLLAIVFIIASIVYAGIFVFYVWKTVARPTDKVSPLARTILLFVPYVELVFYFLVIFEFSKRANGILGKRDGVYPMSETVSLGFCLLQVINMVVPIIMMGMTFKDAISGVEANPAIILWYNIGIGLLQIVSLFLLVVWVIQSRKAAMEIAEILNDKPILAQAQPVK